MTQWVYYKDPFGFPPPPPPVRPKNCVEGSPEYRQYGDVDNEYYKRFNAFHIIDEILLIHEKLAKYGVVTILNLRKYYNYLNVINLIKTLDGAPYGGKVQRPELIKTMLNESIDRLYTMKEIDKLINV